MAIGKSSALLPIAIFSTILAVSLSKPTKMAISAATMPASPANFQDLPPDTTPFPPTPGAQNPPPLQSPTVVGEAFASGPSWEGHVEKTSTGSATLAGGSALFTLASAALYGSTLLWCRRHSGKSTVR